jgi:hypothetical protein
MPRKKGFVVQLSAARKASAEKKREEDKRKEAEDSKRKEEEEDSKRKEEEETVRKGKRDLFGARDERENTNVPIGIGGVQTTSSVERRR